jgi:branched-chain amino acid transport system substrate-binding protein
MRIRGTAAIAVGLLLAAASCSSSSGGGASGTTTAGTPTSGAGGNTSSPTTGGNTSSPTTGVDGGKNAASDQGVTPTTIKIGFVNAATGIAASSFGPGAYAAAKARIELANDQGGVHGRKIELLAGDDQSVPEQNLSLLKSFNEQQKVFALAVVSPMFFAGYRYTADKGIPVTSAGIDGSPYGAKDSQNMFAAIGSLDPTYKAGDAQGKWLKERGVTTLGVLAYANSPSSVGAAKSEAKSAELAGIKTVMNLNIPFGSTDFTAAALQFKQANVDGLLTAQVLSSNIAAVKAMKAAGISLKASIIDGAYSQEILDNPDARETMQGIGLISGIRPLFLNSPGTTDMRSALKKYANYDKPNPTQGQIYGWQAADLMVRGLQDAGQNPTRQSFIANLLKVNNYEMNDLLGGPVDFSKYGWVQQSTNANCLWMVVAQGDTFVTDPSDGKPICNTGLVPGTEQAK